MMFFAIEQRNTIRKSKLNEEQSTLSMRKLAIHDQITTLEENAEKLTAAFTSITSGISNQASSIFNQAISSSNEKIALAQKAYNNAQSQGLDSIDIKKFENMFNQVKEEEKNAQQKAYTQYQTQMNLIASLTQTFKNVKEAEDKAKIKGLNKEEDRIELRLNSINTEMASLDSELKSATQAAQQRAQELAPKYA
jgi:hypothetical protein